MVSYLLTHPDARMRMAATETLGKMTKGGKDIALAALLLILFGLKTQRVGSQKGCLKSSKWECWMLNLHNFHSQLEVLKFPVS